jgi:hypothetical protein
MCEERKEEIMEYATMEKAINIGDLPDMKSQLDLTPFGVGVPSSIKARFPNP